MTSRSPQLVAMLALVAGLALGIVGTIGVHAATPSSAANTNRPVAIDRSALEAALTERAVTSTGVTKRFDLTVEEANWELLPGVATRAVTFTGTVPGPTIRVTEGDRVEIVVKNTLGESTSIHWHGLRCGV